MFVGSAGHVGGTGIVPSASDVLGMSGVGGVCMCLARVAWEERG